MDGGIVITENAHRSNALNIGFKSNESVSAKLEELYGNVRLLYEYL